MDCPKCSGAALSAKIYEGIEIDVCAKCHGVWLDEDELIQIVRHEEESFSDELVHSTISDAFNGVPKKELEEDVHCPKCSKAMRPVNYDYRSGIVIDRCAEHGIWLDGKELDKVQAHAEHWRAQAEIHRDAWLELGGKDTSNQNLDSDNDMPVILRPFAYVVERVFDLMTWKP